MNTIFVCIVPPTTGSIGDFVCNDANNNGIQDGGEAGIDGVTVTLFDTNGNVVATTTTNPDGSYQFTNVAPGTYTVGFTNLPIGATFSPANQGGDDDTDSDVLASGQTAPFTVAAGQSITNIDAGLYTPTPILIGNFVWNDLNENGIQDANEPGVAGVTVTLFSGTTPIATTQTDAFGNYQFSVPAGTYTIGFTLPVDYVFSPATQGGNTANDSNPSSTTGLTAPFTVTTSNDFTIDAGIFLTNPNTLGSIGDFVWLDTNGDGIQDANEQGVAGVTVTLLDSNGNPVQITVTNANGNCKWSC